VLTKTPTARPTVGNLAPRRFGDQSDRSFEIPRPKMALSIRKLRVFKEEPSKRQRCRFRPSRPVLKLRQMSPRRSSSATSLADRRSSFASITTTIPFSVDALRKASTCVSLIALMSRRNDRLARTLGRLAAQQVVTRVRSAPASASREASRNRVIFGCLPHQRSLVESNVGEKPKAPDVHRVPGEIGGSVRNKRA